MYDHTEYLTFVNTVDPVDVDDVNHTLSKLDRYVKSGGTESVGDFLQGIILGDLELATSHADDVNKKYLAMYLRYCFNQLPSELVLLLQPLSRVLRDRLFAGKPPLTRTEVRQAAGTFDRSLAQLRGED